MYESAFELKQRPFTAAPLPERFFPAGSTNHAFETLARGIERAEGPGLLIGPAGTGKSLVCQMLADRFQSKFRVVTLATARLCTRRALLQNILFELGLPYRDMEEGELRLSLVDHLEPSETCPAGMLLLVDEANTLPLRLLEEVRMITNLVRDGQPRIRLVLAGSPLLEERFANPKLESFNQRITARCYLHSLNRDETLQHIRAQIAGVGGDPDRIFREDALVAVYRATDGIPRLINQVCDHAMIMAALGQRRQIDAAGIEEAWADLQQLPAPWPTDRREARMADDQGTDSNIVEFGQLQPEETSQTIRLSTAPDGDHGQIESTTSLGDSERPRDDSDRAVSASPTEQTTDIEDAGVEPFVPDGKSTPEVELVFHGPHDLFGDSFDEEEIVVDRYASLEAGAVREGHRVSSEEGTALAGALSSQVVPAAPQPEAVDSPQQALEEDTADEHVASSFDAASDPVMPEDDDLPLNTKRESDVAVAAALGEQPASAARLRVAATDDRDLIVVDGDDRPATSGKARRQEYRQLFAKLRRG